MKKDIANCKKLRKHVLAKYTTGGTAKTDLRFKTAIVQDLLEAIDEVWRRELRKTITRIPLTEARYHGRI